MYLAPLPNSLPALTIEGIFEAADVADAAGLGEHGGGGAGHEGDLGLLHVIARDIGKGIRLVAANDRELHFRKTLGDLVDRRLSLAANADHKIILPLRDWSTPGPCRRN